MFFICAFDEARKRRIAKNKADNMNDFFEHLLSKFDLPLNNPVLVFSLVLFIILLAPIVLRRLNIPGIIGLIISGLIIGPHGLNILEKK